MIGAEVKAAQAKRLLEDPLLVEVLGKIEEAAINAWRVSTDPRDREIAWYSLKASERVRMTLESVRDDGLIAANRAVRSSSAL